MASYPVNYGMFHRAFVLSPGTAGTRVWAERLLRKMWQGNINDGNS